MRVSELDAAALDAFLEGPWVAKVATHEAGGHRIRIVPVWYGRTDDGRFQFNAYADSELVRNLRHHPAVALLVDGAAPAYRGVHYHGVASVGAEASDPDQVAGYYARYLGDLDAARAHVRRLHDLGRRVNVWFTPEEQLTWDFATASE